MINKTVNCLIELFSEEIPSRMQINAETEFFKLFKEGCETRGIYFKDYELFSTPRRIALIVKGLNEKQKTQFLEIKGPNIQSKDIAINGFLKTHNEKKKKLKIKKTDKGEFYFIEKVVRGKLTKFLLEDILGDIISNFNWPKSQRWANSDIKWARPLRNILVLLDNKLINGKILIGKNEKILFSDTTYGHRFCEKKVKIKDIQSYKNKMRNHFVYVDRKERKKIILEQIKSILYKNNLKLYQDLELLDEVNGLVEFPNAILCKIEKQFMKLPFDVLSTSMKVHQKYFSLLNKSNKTAPYFIVITNTPNLNKKNKTILSGNEKVLKARLSDALFFWEADIKIPFEQWLEDLENVTFFENLGNLKQRSQRISDLAINLKKYFKYKNLSQVKNAGLFSKVDLLSNMVGEFPELQGIMGGYYSGYNGYNNEFKIALMDQYKPQRQDDDYPRNDLGCILSLSNNLDTLTSFFSIGLQPTGSRDPFALRRCANGIIRILLFKQLKLNLNTLFQLVLEKRSISDKSLEQSLIKFTLERFKLILLEESITNDIIDAILSNSKNSEIPIYLLKKNIINLKNFIKTKKGNLFLKNYKRIFNILKNVEKSNLPNSINESFLKTSSEITLYNYFKKIRSTSNKIVNEINFDKNIINIFLNSNQIITNFFDQTLVNDNDVKLKKNRLRLLTDIINVFGSFVKFEKIQD